LRGHTSGLAVPVFVVDAPGGGGKIPIQPDYLLSYQDGRALLRNFQGRRFRYNDPVVGPSATNGTSKARQPRRARKAATID